jgi:hypothetical protein
MALWKIILIGYVVASIAIVWFLYRTRRFQP